MALLIVCFVTETIHVSHGCVGKITDVAHGYTVCHIGSDNSLAKFVPQRIDTTDLMKYCCKIDVQNSEGV